MKPSLKRHGFAFLFHSAIAPAARPFALDVRHLPSALAEPPLECWPVCHDNGVVVGWTVLVRVQALGHQIPLSRHFSRMLTTSAASALNTRQPLVRLDDHLTPHWRSSI